MILVKGKLFKNKRQINLKLLNIKKSTELQIFKDWNLLQFTELIYVLFYPFPSDSSFKIRSIRLSGINQIKATKA